MDFEKKFKNKTLLGITLVLFVLCSVFLFIGINNQKHYINWQIQKENEVANAELKSLLHSTNQLYRDKIQFFVNNPDIKKNFFEKDINQLYQKVFPFYTVLKSEDPYHFEINFYFSDNQLALNMETGSGNNSRSANENSIVSKVNQIKRKVSGFEFSNGLLYYKIAEPVFSNGSYAGCIEFGIRENEIVSNISSQYNISIATLFDYEKMGKIMNSDFAIPVENGRLLLHSIYHKDFFAQIINQLGHFTEGKIKYQDKYYYLTILEVKNDFKNEGFEGIVYLRDITEYQSQFQATLYRSVLIILLILGVTYLILHFSFSKLLNKFFNLQDSLDKRLAQKTKEILKANTELSQIFNTTGNSMRLIDNNFNILRVNRTFTSISGISKEDAEGRKCYNVFPGPYCHTSECPLNQIKNGKERIEQDIRKRNSEGKIIPGILTSVAFKDDNGEILGIIEDFKDISQRVMAEEALKRTEQQFSIFMDNLPLGVFIKDENLKSTYLNKYMDTVFSNENCQNKTPEEIFPEEYAKRVIEEDKRVLNGEVLIVEDNLPDKRGEVHTYQTHKFRFRGADNTWQIGGVSLDITQKKKTEYDLKILSNAIQHSPICVVITNLKGEIEIVNPSFTQITGYTSEEITGKNISVLNVDNNKGITYNEILSHVISGKDWQGEFQNRKKNGEKYWDLASISPVRNDKGTITHFVIISEDITTRKRNEKELIDAKEKAEEANRLKTAFLANLSHEIRTPMNAIIGFTNLLLDDEISSEEKSKLNSLINENSQNLLKLIDDVIDISKIQSGKIEINKTECYINKLLLDLYVSFSVRLENDTNKDIHLSLHKGSRKKDFIIFTDPIRLKQVLYNLIDNAVKFTTKGFVDFGYTIIEKERKIQFHVIDSGIGISNDKFDMIYDLFRQADESFTREYGGTGVGLTIAKRIIEHLGGEIWVQSTPKQGTNIYFTLPYEETEPKFDQSKSLGENAYNWQNKVFLVAEDVDVNFKLIEEILSPTKAKLIWAKDGKEAVDLCLNSDNIDLVLMDVKMPVMDGYQATEEIKKHKSDLKIIGQTAYALNENENEGNVNFDYCITKPIKIDTFLETINQVFKKN